MINLKKSIKGRTKSILTCRKSHTASMQLKISSDGLQESEVQMADRIDKSPLAAERSSSYRPKKSIIIQDGSIIKLATNKEKSCERQRTLHHQYLRGSDHQNIRDDRTYRFLQTEREPIKTQHYDRIQSHFNLTEEEHVQVSVEELKGLVRKVKQMKGKRQILNKMVNFYKKSANLGTNSVLKALRV